MAKPTETIRDLRDLQNEINNRLMFISEIADRIKESSETDELSTIFAEGKREVLLLAKAQNNLEHYLNGKMVLKITLPGAAPFDIAYVDCVADGIAAFREYTAKYPKTEVLTALLCDGEQVISEVGAFDLSDYVHDVTPAKSHTIEISIWENINSCMHCIQIVCTVRGSYNAVCRALSVFSETNDIISEDNTGVFIFVDGIELYPSEIDYIFEVLGGM